MEVLIGERLSKLLKDSGLSQRQLADRLSISVHAVSSYERNISIPDDGMKIRFDKFFNVSLDYLLWLTSNQRLVN